MRVFVGIGMVAACLLTGCTSNTPEAKYTPAEGAARQALETALGQWRDGQAQPARFPLGKVNVEVLDQNWSSGQKLQSFEIVNEETGAGPRIFTVKLKTARGEQTVKYFVVGIDPLWVYSEADYKKQSGA